MAFEIEIPESEKERTLDDVLKHLAETITFSDRIGLNKYVKESVDMVIAYINKELSYSDALQNIYDIGDMLGIKGITLGPIVVDLNDARELIEC